MEFIEGIRQTLNERIKGAFGGTFIIVWTALNWRIFFMLLNFDKEQKFQDRLQLVNQYVQQNYPWKLLLAPILFSLISVLVFCILNAITLYIVSFFKLRLKPHILVKTGSKDIVEMSRFNAMEKEYEKIKNKYNREQSEFLNSINEKESLKLELDSTKSNLKAQTERVEELIKNSELTMNETRKSYDDQIRLLKRQYEDAQEQFKKSNGNHLRQHVFADLMFIGEWQRMSLKDGNRVVEKITVQDNEMTIIDEIEARIVKIDEMINVDNSFIEISFYDPQRRKSRRERLTIVTDKFYAGADYLNNYIEYRKSNLQ